MKSKLPPTVSFVAKSGTGKTTLIEKIIGILSDKGYRVSSIKHTDHEVDADIPGKDSWRHKKAGAYSTLLLSGKKLAFFSDSESTPAVTIAALAAKYFQSSDILIVEGFKDLDIKKIELFRKDLSPSFKPRFKEDPNLILVCGDMPLELPGIPQLDINSPLEIANFIERHIILEA